MVDPSHSLGTDFTLTPSSAMKRTLLNKIALPVQLNLVEMVHFYLLHFDAKVFVDGMSTPVRINILMICAL